MNALDLLKKDHDRIEGLFRQCRESHKKDQLKIFDQIKEEILTHARIEEKIFYPAADQFDELKELVRESSREHKELKDLLEEMDSMSTNNPEWESKLKMMERNFNHHAFDEEEGKMFPKVQRLMNIENLEKMGKQLEGEKLRKPA